MARKVDIYPICNTTDVKIGMGEMKIANTTLENLEITKSKNYRSSFPTFDINAIYIEENDEAVIKHVITCENFLVGSYPRVESETFSPSGNTNSYLYLGLDGAHIDGYKREVMFEKSKEMTMEEIEKALGHKVKIVKEHKNV